MVSPPLELSSSPDFEPLLAFSDSRSPLAALDDLPLLDSPCLLFVFGLFSGLLAGLDWALVPGLADAAVCGDAAVVGGTEAFALGDADAAAAGEFPGDGAAP